MSDDFDLDYLAQIEGFEWDEDNTIKNKEKHGVETKECEEVFFNRPLIFLNDPKHSTANERRYGLLGISNAGRRIAIYFTVRNRKIRVISARDMSKKDRAVYITEQERQRKTKRGEAL